MTKKINIGSKGRANIKWKVMPIDYSPEKADEITSKFARKYGIPKSHVNIEPLFIKKNEDGTVMEYDNEVLQNIQDPTFQIKLFKKYINDHNIENVDFDEIVKIDDIINNQINYDSYEKCKKYVIKWIKWSNFMSYGPNNFFDFTKLKGLVMLSSEPANQGGKSTFCVDLVRFLLFGKVVGREDDWVLAKAFNDFLLDETEVNVEGCIEIDGVDYVIRRTLTRPALSKRTPKSKVTQKVYYFRLANGNYISLDDAEEENGSSNTETNKIIKEALGNERDFDLMIYVNSHNLEDLISLKDTERGRLISRWVGLLPLEEKDKIARERFNKDIYPSMMLTKYNKEDLQCAIEEMELENKENGKLMDGENEKIKSHEKNIERLEGERVNLLQNKKQVDESLANIDIETLNASIENIISEGKIKRNEKNNYEEELKGYGDINFEKQKYLDKIEEKEKESNNLVSIGADYTQTNKDIEALKKGEYCPTCGAKLKDVDNTDKIKEKEEALNKLMEAGKASRARYNKLVDEIKALDDIRTKYESKEKLELIIEKIDLTIKNLTLQYREKQSILKSINNNKEVIENNNKIDASINVINENIKVENDLIKKSQEQVFTYKTAIDSNNRGIKTNTKVINIIEEEEKTLRNWKVYLEMIGKNGISKMVLRTVLPLINGHLKYLLSDVCDFDVEITINDKNDVAFYLIHDGVKRNLGGGSGFEKTVASLALRSVLSKISSFSRPSFIVFDEVLGCLADENYDKIKMLYDKICNDYEFIFHISHLKDIAEWHNSTVVIKKINNVSKIANN